MSVIFPLSGHTENAVKDTASRLKNHVERYPNLPLSDLAYTYQIGKTEYSHRKAFITQSREELINQCREDFSVRQGTNSSSSHRIAFLFTGQGSQYSGMGSSLYQHSKVFREGIDRCARILDRLLPTSLHHILFDSSNNQIHETSTTQPALFAFEYALAQTWIDLGFTPSVLLGHSLGEWVAACISGGYTLEDACRLVHQRGFLMRKLCQPGAMAAISSNLNEIEMEEIKNDLHRHSVTVAAINSPRNIVIAGKLESVADCVEDLRMKGIRCQPLSVSHAFHSPLMEPMLASFEAQVLATQSTSLDIPLISNLDGKTRTQVDSHYWTQQISSPVRFDLCLQALKQTGVDLVIEIGPHPTLAPIAERALGTGLTVLHSLRRGFDEINTLNQNLGNAWMDGHAINWEGLYSKNERSPKRVHVPTYPYQRQNYSIENAAVPPKAPAGSQKKQLLLPNTDLATFEQILIKIWTEVIGIQTIGPQSDFLELGTDSLGSVELLSRMKQMTGCSLTLEELYQKRTLGQIAELLHTQLRSHAPGHMKTTLVIGAESRLKVQIIQELRNTTSTNIVLDFDTENVTIDTIFYISEELSPEAFSNSNKLTRYLEKHPQVKVHWITPFVPPKNDQPFEFKSPITTYRVGSLKDFTPLNYAASAIVELSLNGSSRTYYICNPWCPPDGADDTDNTFHSTQTLLESLGVYCPWPDQSLLFNFETRKV